jgi:hypothetical protein
MSAFARVERFSSAFSCRERTMALPRWPEPLPFGLVEAIGHAAVRRLQSRRPACGASARE